jgi:hypothetical protein
MALAALRSLNGLTVARQAFARRDAAALTSA